MIDKFGTLCVGTVEHDEIGFDAPPVNERRYDAERLASPLDTTQQLAELMDRCGYETLWLAEHHFQREGYECIPNIPLLATHLAAHTERLRFGCGFNVLPVWHPIRLAEDYAMADILTKGRVRLGVGRGYHSRELEVLGAPHYSADGARELFEEQVSVLLTALRDLGGITLGQASWLFNGFLLLVATALGRRPTANGILFSFMNGFWVDVWLSLINDPDNLAMRILFVPLGTVAIAGGVAMVIHAGLTGGAMELLMNAGEDRGRDPFKVRRAIEGTIVVAGVLLGGDLGPATIFFVLTMSPILKIGTQALEDHRTGRAARLRPVWD